MKTLLYLCFGALLSFSATAQVPTPTAAPPAGRVISGKLQDPAGAPVPYATVNVLDSAAAVLTGGISDEQGGFRVEGVPARARSIEFRFLGYDPLTQALPIGNRRLELGTVRLRPAATQLGEVTVTGEKATIDLQLDKKVFDVSKDLLSQGGSATDVLNGVPAVTVNATGGVSLRGNSNVTVLINGRRSGLTQSTGLDQIPASQIERVEVITNPSARYDAAGSAGIINVVLKKNKAAGLGGQLRVVGGLPNDTRLTPSLTYQAGRVNLFATAGLRNSDYLGRYRTEQVTGQRTDHPSSLRQQQRENRHDDGRLLYVGGDFTLSEHQTLTAAFLHNATRDHDRTTLHYDFAQTDGRPDSTLLRHGESKERRSYNQLEMNYTRLSATPGRKLTVDLQYDFWNSAKTWQLDTRRLYPQEQAQPGIRTSSVGASNDLLAQTDLVRPLTARLTLETGLKTEYRQVSSDFRAEAQQGDNWAVFQGIDNQLQYQELIGGAYAQLGYKAPKFSYLLGLRTELTTIDIRDREGVYRNHKRYQRLFPTLNLSYKLSEALTSQLSYSRRINRPALWMLYPFNELTDLNAQYVGNPDLNPSYGDAVEAALLAHWGPLTLNPSVYYQRNTGFIQTYVYRNAAGIFISTPINLRRETRQGLELSVLYNPAKWLQTNAELNLFRFRQQGRYQDQDFGFTGHTLTGQLGAQLRLPASFGLQGRYFVEGPRRNAQTRTSTRQYLNLGLSRKLLHDQLTVVLDGTNVLNTNQTRTRTTGPDYAFEQVSNFNAARYRLTLSYRFNQREGQAIRQARSSNRN